MRRSIWSCVNWAKTFEATALNMHVFEPALVVTERRWSTALILCHWQQRRDEKLNIFKGWFLSEPKKVMCHGEKQAKTLFLFCARWNIVKTKKQGNKVTKKQRANSEKLSETEQNRTGELSTNCWQFWETQVPGFTSRYQVKSSRIYRYARRCLWNKPVK